MGCGVPDGVGRCVEGQAMADEGCFCVPVCNISGIFGLECVVCGVVRASQNTGLTGGGCVYWGHFNGGLPSLVSFCAQSCFFLSFPHLNFKYTGICNNHRDCSWRCTGASGLSLEWP